MSYAIKHGTGTFFMVPEDYEPGPGESLVAEAPHPPTPTSIWQDGQWVEDEAQALRAQTAQTAAEMRPRLTEIVRGLPVSARLRVYRELWPAMEAALGERDFAAVEILLGEFQPEPEFEDVKTTAVEMVQARDKGREDAGRS